MQNQDTTYHPQHRGAYKALHKAEKNVMMEMRAVADAFYMTATGRAVRVDGAHKGEEADK